MHVHSAYRVAEVVAAFVSFLGQHRFEKSIQELSKALQRDYQQKGREEEA
jgi:hypothetical protein